MFKKLNEELKKFLQLNEMVNWNQQKTGLPCYISFQTPATDGKTYKHKKKRIDFQNNTSNKFQGNEAIPIDIETGEVLVNKKVDKKLLKQVIGWVELNKEMLINMWDGKITPEEAEQYIKKFKNN